MEGDRMVVQDEDVDVDVDVGVGGNGVLLLP